jgi:hypothetical protein
MNKNKIEEKLLIKILKERGLEKPSDQFSNELTQLLVSSYKKNQVAEHGVGKWLGKFILSVLVFLNLLFFYYLNPFSVQPVLFMSLTAFVLGFWILIVLVKKYSNAVAFHQQHTD